MEQHLSLHQTRRPPSPGGGGSRAISAFTRVFDALWRAGWGELLCEQAKFTPPRLTSRYARCFADPPPPGEGEERARLAPRIPYRLNIHQTALSRRNRAMASSSSPSSAFRISS